MRITFTLVLLLALYTPACSQQVIVSDFDDVPTGYSAVTYHYPGLVVGYGEVTPDSLARSAPNVLCAYGDLSFSQGATWVSFYSRLATTVAAYSYPLAGNHLLGLVQIDGPADANGWVYTELRYAEPIGILGVGWDSTGGGPIGPVLDDLTYELVPEPASIAVLLAGLAGVEGMALRRRRS